MAYVVDDPNVVMQMQSSGVLSQTELGNNIAVVQTGGSTSIGRSKNSLGDTGATTNTLPMRIIEFVEGPSSTVGDAFTDALVFFNVGHQYTNTTGV